LTFYISQKWYFVG